MARELFYLIEKILTADENNKNFAGEVHRTIYGKGNYTLLRETPDKWGDHDFLTPGFIREKGYRRESDARRNWTYKNPDIDEPHWHGETRIIAAAIHEGGRVEIIR